MKEIKSLFEKVEPELLQAFSFIPEYGSLAFIIHVVEKEPVRLEWKVSTSRKLLRKSDRRNV